MNCVVAGLLVLAVSSVMVPSAAEAQRDVVTLQAKEEPEGGKDEKAQKKRLSDAQIRKILIEESIAAYSGNCPCPYSTMRNGRSCGRRSAYSRPGGEAPLCYAKDVTAEMVQAYRDANTDT
jgi:hypothetical protein